MLNIITSLAIENFKLYLRGLPHKFRYDFHEKLYYIIDGLKKHYFSNLNRGLLLYSNGLDYRSNQIANSYMLSEIKFEKSDLVIDCGANYADLFIYLQKYIDPSGYIAFEPGREEFKAIEKNAPMSNNYNLALGIDNAFHNFYLCNQSADSSVIEPKTWERLLKIKTITLDQFVVDNNIKIIKLLKLEAEGYEPEILRGAINTLKSVKYIAIDGSYERGINQDETFTMQTNFLIQNGFEILKINFDWCRALFKNNRSLEISP